MPAVFDFEQDLFTVPHLEGPGIHPGRFEAVLRNRWERSAEVVSQLDAPSRARVVGVEWHPNPGRDSGSGSFFQKEADLDPVSFWEMLKSGNLLFAIECPSPGFAVVRMTQRGLYFLEWGNFLPNPQE